MKTLLLNPPVGIDSIPDIPPLGLAYLAAVLRDAGIEVKLLDLDLERNRLAELPDLIDGFKPDVVGLGGLTLQIENVYSIAKMVKQWSPTTRVVVGGPHASSLPERTMQEGDGHLDAVVIGEGEYTLLDYIRKSDLSDVDGICFNDGGVIRRTSAPKMISDLDSLPLPARDLLPIHKYRGWGPLRRTPTTHLIASRGCPFECVFCSEKAVFGRGHRRRSAALVVEEIEHLVKQYGMQEVSFYDDLFTLNKSFVSEIVAEMKKRNLRLAWKALSRVDTVDSEMLEEMKGAGCWLISYGFESGSQKILDNIRKKQTVEQSRKAARLTRNAGIRFFGFFMIGNLGETEETIFDTVRLAREIRPDYWQFTITRPDPGSFLYNQHEKEILAQGTSWNDYFAFTKTDNRMPVFGTSLTMPELLHYKEFAYMNMSFVHFIHRFVVNLLRFRWKQALRFIHCWKKMRRK